jgi:hypothetical protein
MIGLTKSEQAVSPVILGVGTNSELTPEAYNHSYERENGHERKNRIRIVFPMFLFLSLFRRSHHIVLHRTTTFSIFKKIQVKMNRARRS